MRLRFRIRTLMIAAAVVAVVAQGATHVWKVLHQDDELAWVVLVIEGYAALAALGVLWVISLIRRVMRNDDEYVQQLDDYVNRLERNTAGSQAKR